MTKNIPPIFSGPISAGLVRIEQLYQPGIGFDDILDLNEIMMIKNENEYRSVEAGKKK